MALTQRLEFRQSQALVMTPQLMQAIKLLQLSNLDLTDRSYIIYSGQVLMEGRKDDIVNDPEVRRLYLGEEFRV